MKLDIPDEDFFEILDVLRLAHVYTFLHAPNMREELGEDFKPGKFEGYEKQHAEKALRQHKRLIDLAAVEVERRNKEIFGD